VRSSWLMLARKRSFAWLARSSSTFFSWSVCSKRLRSVASRIAAVTSSPSSVWSGLRLISTGNSLPSLRRPYSERPAPMGLGRVADRGGDQHSLFGLQRAETDLDRELAAVLPEAVKSEALSHGPQAGLGEEAGAMAGVLPAEAGGNEDLDRLADDLVAAISE